MQRTRRLAAIALNRQRVTCLRRTSNVKSCGERRRREKRRASKLPLLSPHSAGGLRSGKETARSQRSMSFASVHC